MFEPVVILEAFLRVMLGRVSLIGLNETLHFVVFLQPSLILRHTLKAIIILGPALWPEKITAKLPKSF